MHTHVHAIKISPKEYDWVEQAIVSAFKESTTLLYFFPISSAFQDDYQKTLSYVFKLEELPPVIHKWLSLDYTWSI